MIDAYSDKAVWIKLLDDFSVSDQINKLESAKASGQALPLYGVPFAVKDNIDVAGHATTAACPAFGSIRESSAAVVRKLCEAGAILMGKTNLDQFATGLVGVRSPYGACKNPFNPKYISGGSSSGSAVAVAAGLVSFSLGTDTAGSGRVPAAFNNIVGYKPTRGLISTTGVVPACRSLDCVSIFALTCEDAATVANVARGFDATDGYSRRLDDLKVTPLPSRALRLGIPRPEQLKFFGDSEVERLYRQSIERIKELGHAPVEFDFEPFSQTAALLYSGPWVAERLAALKEFIAAHADAMQPVVRQIVLDAEKFSAVDLFRAEYRLHELRQMIRPLWETVDVLLLPTAGTIYAIEAVEKDPIQLNSNLGYYTNFVNLLDLCGVAIPAGFCSTGLPAGVTLLSTAGRDEDLLRIAGELHRAAGVMLGATKAPMPAVSAVSTTASANPGVLLAVVGAHLGGQPLNGQLTSRNARLVKACRTAATYKLYALPNTTPPKPGLVRIEGSAGSQIEVEVWELSTEAFGSFVADVPPPMVIGTLMLEDGSSVKGFLCEPFALEGAQDISKFGGWRAYLKSR
jgi:allophanate hydrolase